MTPLSPNLMTPPLHLSVLTKLVKNYDQRLPSLTIFGVLSRNNVSFGDIFVNTTFCIDDFPLLKAHNQFEVISVNPLWTHYNISTVRDNEFSFD